MPGRGRAPSEGAVPAGLKLGRNGQDRTQVSDIQRTRMIAGMVEEVAERGAANVTVAHVVNRSGVSRRTFYEVFEHREDCFLAALNDGIERLAREAVPAYERPGSWRERIRAGVVASLAVLDSEPDLALLLIVESLGAGPAALKRRSQVVDGLIAVVEAGGSEARAAARPIPLAAEGVVGAVLAVLHGRLIERAHGEAAEHTLGEAAERTEVGLLALTNSLMGMIVLPYLGAAAARRELDRPVSKVQDTPRRAGPDPLRELEMRLTYRTVRVLMAVAESPGSSNRAIADGASIGDQGQISKLLARLQGLGLVENTGRGRTRGEPNAWTLTEKGWEVQDVIAHQPISA
jgi:AcrR family transcriptional regulator/DNA-binding MarR family transcriptional regulator